jgi:hypothetical protein
MFEQADTQSKAVAHLGSEIPFTVLGTEGECYQVRLSDGTLGGVYAHKWVGWNMPRTAMEQHQADERAAAAARPPADGADCSGV